MSGKVAIVSAGDDQYFHLLDGLIASLEDAGLPSHFNLCVYDVGLTSQQVVNLSSRNVKVVAPPWTLEFPSQAKSPCWFRAMTNRPYLPKYFPGYETYLWIDADTWLQQPEGIHAAVEVAQQGSIAIVAERFARSIVFPRPNPLGGFRDVVVNEALIRQNLASCYRECFGQETEYRAQQTIYNTGFFALRGDSPIWDQWVQYIRRGLNRAMHRLVEQQAMNLGILESHISATVLSNRYNWNITCLEPLYDPTIRQLVDPNDRKPLGLVHLTDVKHLHFVEVPNIHGRTVRLWLRYREFRTRPIEEDV
jgi:lipopolysaccharide biosynthesis glycosyltransferase